MVCFVWSYVSAVSWFKSQGNVWCVWHGFLLLWILTVCSFAVATAGPIKQSGDANSIYAQFHGPSAAHRLSDAISTFGPILARTHRKSSWLSGNNGGRQLESAQMFENIGQTLAEDPGILGQSGRLQSDRQGKVSFFVQQLSITRQFKVFYISHRSTRTACHLKQLALNCQDICYHERSLPTGLSSKAFSITTRVYIYLGYASGKSEENSNISWNLMLVNDWSNLYITTSNLG